MHLQGALSGCACVYLSQPICTLKPTQTQNVTLPQAPSYEKEQVSLRACRAMQVGGMGDVVTALARAVQDEGHRVSVIIPKYDCLDYAEVCRLPSSLFLLF